MSRSTIAILIGLSAVNPAAQAPTVQAFVACPIVQDTKTVPCWVSEYDGERYYLGIQTDISAEFHPPYLGHQVLVEGTVSTEPRICGGIVLKPVRVSPLPEFDSSCNTILPAVDQYTVPFAPRPPGPSGGRLAFQGAPPSPAPAQTRSSPVGPREFVLQYDFDNGVMGRHAGTLGQIENHARAIKATRIRITGYRGATKLSNGKTLIEREGIAEARAEEIASLLKEAGLITLSIDVSSPPNPEAATGIDDWRSRRTVVVVEP